MEAELTIQKALDELRDLAEHCRRVPFSNMAMIDHAALLELVEHLEKNLPAEFEQARRIINDQGRLLQKAEHIRAEAEQKVKQANVSAQLERNERLRKANEDAQQILAEAERKAEDRVSQAVIVQEAQRRALIIENNAHAEAEQEKLAYFNACSEMLKRTEELLGGLFEQTRAGQQELLRWRSTFDHRTYTPGAQADPQGQYARGYAQQQPASAPMYDYAQEPRDPGYGQQEPLYDEQYEERPRSPRRAPRGDATNR